MTCRKFQKHKPSLVHGEPVPPGDFPFGDDPGEDNGADEQRNPNSPRKIAAVKMELQLLAQIPENLRYAVR
jgi:hypothetical protein